MKGTFQIFCGLSAGLLLAACQPDPPKEAVRPPVAPPLAGAGTARPATAPPPRADYPKELTVTVPRYLRSHRRYVGTLDGRELVLELMPVDNRYELVSGSMYFVHDPRATEFRGSLVESEKPAKSLKMRLSDDSTTVTLMLLPPFGRQLRVLWTTDRDTAAQLVALHENYTGAVRYEMLTATASGPPMGPQAYGDVAGSIPSYTRAYLHLLGPDTLRPGLRRLQALPPKRMRQAVRYYLRHEAEGGCRYTEELSVSLNGYDLLSYRVALYDYMFGSPHGNRSEDLRTVDLRTGQPVHPERWFRAGTDPAQRQLIYRRMLATGDTADYPPGALDPRTGVRELPGQYDLTPAGIVARYGDYVLGGSYSRGSTDVLLPYAEVAPLLKPGTPLDRILTARGLRAGH